MRKTLIYSTVSLPLLAGVTVYGQNSRPNIIYILADDLGYNELGCYGQKKIETPHIDNLAKDGMRFTQHYAGSAVSAPSRCVLMTGLHSGHAYIRGNDEMPERGDVWSHEAMLENSYLEGQRPIPSDTKILPLFAKEAGYTTACIGKWGLGYPGSEGAPEKMGFDLFYGYNCQRQAHTYYPPFLYRNENREHLNNQLLPPNTKLDQNASPYINTSYNKYTQPEYAPDKMFAEIVDFVNENRQTPFLLMWTTPLPHVPLQAPERWVNYYVDKFGEEEPYKGDKGYFPCRYPHATYAAMISYMDEQVGLLVQQLKELGLYENTLIIFTSDNGPTFNGGSDSPWFDSASPFKSDPGWGKASIREGGIRVPMIACWPKEIKKGSVSHHISAFWDVLPTICDIIEVPSLQTDGISFLPELTGRRQKEHEYLYWEYPEGTGSKALRMGKWKGYWTDIKKGNTYIQLFNLETDPTEQQDVSSEYPSIVGLIHKKMEEAHEEPIIEKFRM